MAALEPSDWYVTPDKVEEAIKRLVRAVDPIAIIVFGSRARGQYRPDSDLDLAVILDVGESDAMNAIPWDIFAGLRMPVDLLPMPKERYERFRPWLNSVQNAIDREGVRLYERNAEPADSAVVRQIC